MAKTQEADPITEAPTEATETATEQTNGAKGGARPRPTYMAEKVSELPADMTLPRGGARPDPAFIEALQVAQGDPGVWYCVGTYQSVGGAKAMSKRIQKGDVKLPGPGEWDIEARRVQKPGGSEDERWSKLYARFNG